ncbi:ABC transporter substrate-binding protein [Thalassospira sp. MCCC 1A01428]|uniref:ABC transporter substrate-binding protein n=1 Tax=Thalassospira sp. MCCC 1A01428 TaxID=1470575 RepID=UPI000A1F4ACC|nr:ABC transporter substrate-binding protein [Thalassospira sp. MCCC 1A01428]OSQ44489.1 ABC transporter substrate-binding protein [Thalassospira sp. MCCC 1A01428]
MTLIQKLLAGAGVAGTIFVMAGPAQAAKLAISCGAVGQELSLCKEGVEAWSKKTGNDVDVISTPNSSTDRLALYQQMLASGSSDVDIFQIDVIWPGILGNHFIDLNDYMADEAKAHFKPIIENNTVDGRLVAMPWFTDAGVLYYRKDLLDQYGENVPETWDQLTKTAQKIEEAERKNGNDKMWGYVFQGRAYEGLTCNAVEWVASYGGGTIVETNGDISINNDKAKQAIATAAGWIGTISPDGVLGYDEEGARGVFQSGNSVFMRNWPYAWALANSADSPVKGKVGVAPLPKGGDDGQSAAALGGWQLSVSKYSKNPELAADLVKYLTSYDEQKRRAIKGSYNPTVADLYKDKDVLAANPFFGDLYETFTHAVPRPSTATGTNYNKVSNDFWQAVHATLSGTQTADQALPALEHKLKRTRRSGW